MSTLVYSTVTVLVLVLTQQVWSSSVSLNVVGDSSQLVGPQCPGTIRLICEGVDLTILQWYYNDRITVGEPFPPDAAINTTQRMLTNPAFQLIELINILQNETELLLGTFESALTLNLSALETQGIHRIGCGNTMALEYIDVNISIREDRTPQVFNLSVTESPDSSVLTVTWMQNTTTICPQYLEEVLYEVSVHNGYNDINRTLHSIDCIPLCSLSFDKESQLTTGVPQNYTVTLGVTNSNGLIKTIIHRGAIPDRMVCLEPRSPPHGHFNNLTSSSLLFGVDTEITYQCDDGLLPTGVMTSICTDVGRTQGEWLPDPSQLVCSGGCVDLTSSGSIYAPLTSNEVVGLCIAIFVVAVVMGILVGLLIMYGIMRRINRVNQESPTTNVPYYEEVLPSKFHVSNEDIELKRNQSYGRPIL